MAGTPSTETLPRKTTLTIVSAIVLMSLLPHIPALQHFRGFEPTQLRSSLTLHPPVPGKLIIPAEDHTQATAHDKTQNGQITKPSETSSSPYLIIPPGSMDVFFAALRRTESKQAGAVTRILHYGDSPTTADSITADVRALLQQRFGDAGHGFVLIAKPWAWYGHRGIKLEGSGWHIAPASQAREMDGIHGLGGVSFRGQTGATSTVDLPDDLYTHAVVYYLAQPDGGSFKVQTKGRIVAEVDTNGPEKKPGFAEFSLPAGTGSVNLLVTSGHVRLFGYRFDKALALTVLAKCLAQQPYVLGEV